MRKLKKQVKDTIGISMLGAGGSLALADIGSPVIAGHGQQGIARATGHLPAIGSLSGVGMMMRAVKNLEPKKKRKRR